MLISWRIKIKTRLNFNFVVFSLKKYISIIYITYYREKKLLTFNELKYSYFMPKKMIIYVIVVIDYIFYIERFQ